MKKLMFAAAAIAAGVAFADVTSANVVGYQTQTAVGSGITWAMSTFQQIGNELEEQTVSSFNLPVDQGFMSADSIIMEVYNEGGTRDAAYVFVDNNNYVNFGLSKPGWYLQGPISGWYATDADYAGDEVIPFGHGVIITSGEADAPLTSAGQVVDKELTFKVFGSGITWTGNATPKNLTLKDFAIPADQGFLSADSIILERWGSDGTSMGQYVFVDNNNYINFGLSQPGWYAKEPISGWYATDADLCNDVEIPTGVMVIITSGEADTTLTLPNPMK